MNTCDLWLGDQYCGATEGVREYLPGQRCPQHTPAALLGQPEPSGQYCAPARCYCGESPWWRPVSVHTAHALAWKAIDAHAIATGKRRSSTNEFQAARDEVAAQKARKAS